MELSKEAMNFGKFSWKVKLAEGKKAAKKGTKKAKRTNRDRLEFTSVGQTVRRFVRPDDLLVF